jgi:hypothetical protein
LLAPSHNIHLTEKDHLKEIVNPISGKRYPNFSKTLHYFLECPPHVPRPETDQEEAKEQTIQEIKKMVALPLDPKSAAPRRLLR